VFWGCGDDIQVFALFATKFEADLCVFPAKFAKTRKLNQTFAYNDILADDSRTLPPLKTSCSLPDGSSGNHMLSPSSFVSSTHNHSFR